MTIETNAFGTFDATGNREDLTDEIYMVSPSDTPFVASIPTATAEAVLHEWQTIGLSAIAQNAQLEGDTFAAAASTGTTRLSNSCQISYKIPRVTRTQQVVNKAGRKDELGLQIYLRSLELKREVEANLLRNNAEVTRSTSGTVAELGGIEAWIDTNTDSGAGGSDGSLGNTARTLGAARAFTEVMFRSVRKKCWDSGGDPDLLLLDSFNKQVFSGFQGNATRMKTAEDKKLVATIDIYDDEFGSVQVVPCRHIGGQGSSVPAGGSALLIQKNMWALATLDSFHMEDLAKTGDSKAKALVVEYTLESRNEASSGAVWDLAVT